MPAAPDEASEAESPVRTIEEMISSILDQDPGTLEQAQEIVYAAWEAEQPEERIMLALRALQISSSCADAFVLLAEEASSSLDEAIGLYTKGLEAGKRALGEEPFKEQVGHFWSVLETRPYMRAKAGLAQCLWLSGRRAEAVDHYKEMLRLNPNDNQGVRYLLLPCLIEMGEDAAAETLAEQYRDDSMAMWRYSRALLDFRKHGDSPAANESLKEAIAQNEHVPAYLLGRKEMPPHLPESYGYGDEEEAVVYTYTSGSAWAATPGALQWLAAHIPQVQ
jgi:tetratricopeptide (TPR) repeat protein